MFISSDFALELFKACLTNEKVLLIAIKYIKIGFFENQVQRTCFKSFFNYYEVNSKTPTIGILSQNIRITPEILEFLARVKQLRLETTEVEILQQLELFIKKSRFAAVFDEVAGEYNKGKYSEAIENAADKFAKIHEFSLVSEYYERVFGDYDKRQEIRKEEINTDKPQLLSKLSYGHPEIDKYTQGGMRRGTATLAMAESGGGKSTYLRWSGSYNATMGAIVVHFQAEGSQRECLDLYDSTWTGLSSIEIEQSNLPEKKIAGIAKAREKLMQQGGEIYVYAKEQFDSMSIAECREVIYDIIKIHGRVDLIIFDYLELFTTIGNYSQESGERRRRTKIANEMVNMSIEFNAAVLAATQSMDVSKELSNNPDFVLRRSHINEFKGMVRPFANFFTINQTDDEKKAQVARLYFDKFRRFKAPKLFYIVQDLNRGRFINIKKTMETFYPENKNQ